MKFKLFENKNCFITGATGGIGKQIALQMAANGCNLFLTATNSAKLKSLKEEIEASQDKKRNIFYQAGDFNKIQDINKIIALAKEKMLIIDILINCAGIFVVKNLSDSSLEDFETSFNLNVRSAFIFCKEFSKGMVKKKWGRIINIGSSSAYTGYKKTSLYCASKHALLGFSRSLHKELKDHNIRTFCVSPGAVKTRMGKLIENQNFDTFIDPKELARYIVFVVSFDQEMVSEEIKLNRVVIE
ncbi:MAG: SDR family oxidoreductase [Candidatus Omnitrophica bacterium]|nr:SDR family oxidoreductase [Candidatus Omnitrophota bacterium]MBU2266236.1 SDR family oxidoreductase [Candidatus Omnitrophota bacterium]